MHGTVAAAGLSTWTYDGVRRATRTYDDVPPATTTYYDEDAMRDRRTTR
jgi:hypothetical protein